MPPPTTSKDRNQAENQRALRAETRRNGSTTVLEEQQDINDALEGRKFLEKHSLLCPPGEPPTHISLSTCLHQISVMAGVTKPILNSIRSVAFLLEELEETQINYTVKEAFDSQITEFTLDMKILVEYAKEKIDGHLKSSEERLAQLAETAATQVRQSQPAANSYASALVSPPPHANPRVAAREGIKARQFLLEGIKETKFSHLDVFQLRTQLNKILTETGLTNGKIRAANGVRNGGTLIEMDSDEATLWFQNTDNRKKFCQKLGPNVESRTRIYNLIALNASLSINPDDQEHRKEVCEANNLEPDTITAMKWIKPVNRRSPEQRTAHMILSFTNADAANRAITNGLYICNRRCYVEKVKKEPTRCLKCQGWNHFAKDCLEKDDTCSNCAQSHRTKECPTPLAKRCVSCKSNEHASWSRDCPTFVKKVNELNDRNPENALQYIPTTDPWTWTTTEKRASQAHPAPLAKINYVQERPRQARRAPYEGRKIDSYVPNYDNHPPRSQPTQLLDERAQKDTRDALDFGASNQQSIQDFINEVNKGITNSTPELQ